MPTGRTFCIHAGRLAHLAGFNSRRGSSELRCAHRLICITIPPSYLPSTRQVSQVLCTILLQATCVFDTLNASEVSIVVQHSAVCLTRKLAGWLPLKRMNMEDTGYIRERSLGCGARFLLHSLTRIRSSVGMMPGFRILSEAATPQL